MIGTAVDPTDRLGCPIIVTNAAHNLPTQIVPQAKDARYSNPCRSPKTDPLNTPLPN